MSPAGAAFAWEFRRRLRGGLIVLGVYVLVLATFQFVLVGPRSALPRADSALFAFLVLVPFTAAFLFLLAVFSYGLAGDLTARHSLYPARMFTLPISTAELAGWPMLYGTVSMATLTVVAILVGLRPSGVQIPLVWPALFAATFLAWMQVVTWMPCGLPGLRVVAAVVLLTSVDAVVIAARELELSPSFLVALLAPQLPLAYLAARSAVARGRRGEVPDWRVMPSRSGRAAARPFSSALAAQRWVEWRQHGRSLPGWVAIVLPFEGLLVHLFRDEPPRLTRITLAAMLLTPPFLAAFVASTMGRSNPEGRDTYGLSPFDATRPLTTASLVAAKMRMALTSTLLAWLLVLAAIPLALTLAGSWPVVTGAGRRTAEFIGAPRVFALAAMTVGLLVVVTWKQLVQGLAIGLTGRERLIKSSVLVRLSSLVLLVPAADHLSRRDGVLAAAWNAIPSVLAVLASVKLVLASWIAARLSRDRLLDDHALVKAAACWLALVLAVAGGLAWLVATPHLPNHLLLLLAVLAVPLVRPSLVPLALGSNRHRGAAPAAGARPAGVRVGLVLATPLACAVVAAMTFYARNHENGGFVSSGEAREYLLYVPKTYDPARPTPLVISMHGGGLWGAVQRDMSQWNAVADEEGFIVVYPSGARGRGPRAWRAGTGSPETDVRFIAELIDTLKASYTIDPARIYADGLSNGGGMAFRLSCTIPDRIAAVGLVASAQFMTWSDCRDPRPVPMIAFHGTDDRFTPYHGGSSPVAPRWVFPPIPGFTERWALRNRCAGSPSETRVASDVTRRAYGGCENGADVVLYTIHGGGHTWPDGGPQPEWFAGTTTRSVNAAREAWSFYRAHPLVLQASAQVRERGQSSVVGAPE